MPQRAGLFRYIRPNGPEPLAYYGRESRGRSTKFDKRVTMKAGRVSDDILYVMGIVPGVTTGVSILGANQSTIYRDRPGKIRYSEMFTVEGNPSAQALEITAASREFYPLAMVCETYQDGDSITSVRVSARLEFCADMRYVLCQLFWQDFSTSQEEVSDEILKLSGLNGSDSEDEVDAIRHALSFIRRAKAEQAIRERAWGDEQTRFGKPIKASATPVKRGSARSVRRLYLTDGPRESKATDRNVQDTEDRTGIQASPELCPHSGAKGSSR